MQLAKDLHEIVAECPASGGSGAKLLPHNPALQLLPILRCRPPGMLGPLSFFHAVPIALIRATQAFLLLHEPFGISFEARCRNLRESGFLALRTGINAETSRNRFRRNPD